MNALPGYACVQPPYFEPGNCRRNFFLRMTHLQIMGQIDEISTKRIDIEEKIRGHFFLSTCLWSQ